MARTRASTLEFINEIFPTGMVFRVCIFVLRVLDSLVSATGFELCLFSSCVSLLRNYVLRHICRFRTMPSVHLFL